MRRTSGALSADFAEQAVERQNDEVLDRIGDATFAEIASIDRALARLNAGRYGTCAQCRKPIDARRLAAWPYAETCVRCSK